MDSKIGVSLRKAKTLSDAQGWIQSITPELQIKTIRIWIQQEQLVELGVDGDGQIIGTYSFATEVASGGRKQEGEHFTLEDTSAFFRSMFITVLASEIIIDADSTKMEDQDWWREEILNLTDDSLIKFTMEAKTGYIKYVRRTLGINP